MTTAPAKSSTPTHRVYSVPKTPAGSDKKAFWTEIGAAWTHSDGKGFNLRLNLVPVNASGEIVVRIIEPKDAKEGAAQ